MFIVSSAASHVHGIATARLGFAIPLSIASHVGPCGSVWVLRTSYAKAWTSYAKARTCIPNPKPACNYTAEPRNDEENKNTTELNTKRKRNTSGRFRLWYGIADPVLATLMQALHALACFERNSSIPKRGNCKHNSIHDKPGNSFARKRIRMPYFFSFFFEPYFDLEFVRSFTPEASKVPRII